MNPMPRPVLQALVSSAALASRLPVDDVAKLRNWAAEATAFSGLFSPYEDGDPSCPLTASGVLVPGERPVTATEWDFVAGFDSACSYLGIFSGAQVVQVID